MLSSSVMLLLSPCACGVCLPLFISLSLTRGKVCGLSAHLPLPLLRLSPSLSLSLFILFFSLSPSLVLTLSLSLLRGDYVKQLWGPQDLEPHAPHHWRKLVTRCLIDEPSLVELDGINELAMVAQLASNEDKVNVEWGNFLLLLFLFTWPRLTAEQEPLIAVRLHGGMRKAGRREASPLNFMS